MSYDTFNTILRASGSCLGPQYHDRTLMVDQAMVTLRWRCPHRAPSASSHLTGHSAPGLPIPLSCTPSLSIRLRAEGEAVKDGQDAQTHLCLFFFPVRKSQELHQKILQPLLPTDKNTPQNYKALCGFARDDWLIRFR